MVVDLQEGGHRSGSKGGHNERQNDKENDEERSEHKNGRFEEGDGEEGDEEGEADEGDCDETGNGREGEGESEEECSQHVIRGPHLHRLVDTLHVGYRLTISRRTSTRAQIISRGTVAHCKTTWNGQKTHSSNICSDAFSKTETFPTPEYLFWTTSQ